MDDTKNAEVEVSPRRSPRYLVSLFPLLIGVLVAVVLVQYLLAMNEISRDYKPLLDQGDAFCKGWISDLREKDQLCYERTTIAFRDRVTLEQFRTFLQGHAELLDINNQVGNFEVKGGSVHISFGILGLRKQFEKTTLTYRSVKPAVQLVVVMENDEPRVDSIQSGADILPGK